MTIVFWLIRN